MTMPPKAYRYAIPTKYYDCLLYTSIAKRFRRLLKITVSGELRYFGVESSMTRPPKPITLPLSLIHI